MYLKYTYQRCAMEKSKHFGIHVDFETHYKLRSISAYEGRSINGQILYLVRRCIEEFEAEHGPIPLPPSQK